MEVQRCVWRCLSGSPGADSPEYNACVASRCNGAAPAPQPPASATGNTMIPATAPRWSAGATADGLGHFAAVIDPERLNTFYVICLPDGRRWFSIAGPEGGDAALVLHADDGLYALNFVERGDAYYADVGTNPAAFEALRAAQRVTLSNSSGWPLFSVVMNGAREAIGAACR